MLTCCGGRAFLLIGWWWLLLQIQVRRGGVLEAHLPFVDLVQSDGRIRGGITVLRPESASLLLIRLLRMQERVGHVLQRNFSREVLWANLDAFHPEQVHGSDGVRHVLVIDDALEV